MLVTLKSVASAGTYLRGLAPGQHSSEEGHSNTFSDLTGVGIEPQR